MANMNAMTATTLAYAIPEWWVEDLIHNVKLKAFWGTKFSGGEGTSSPILENTDLTKTAGDTLHFQTVSELQGKGITGGGDSTLLEGNEEQLSLGQFDVTLDYIENAVAVTRKAKDQSIKGVVKSVTGKLEDWMARKISDDVFKAMIDTATTGKTIAYAGGVANVASLTSLTVLTPDDIDLIRLNLIRQGAIPFKAARKGDSEQEWYGMVISENDLYQLRGNQDIKDALIGGWTRGESNPLFSAARFAWNGVLIYTHPAIQGKKGTYIRPETTFGSAISTTSCRVGKLVADPSPDVIDYLRYFPSSGYVTNGTTTTQYTAKTSTKENFSLDGNFSTGWTLNDPMYLCNASGVVYSRCIAFGGEIAARGWGKKPFLTENNQSYGQRQGTGICACYGVSAVKNADSIYPNFVQLYTSTPIA